MALKELIDSEIAESIASGGHTSRIDKVKVDAAGSAKPEVEAALKALASEVRELPLEDEFVGISEDGIAWRVRLLRY